MRPSLRFLGLAMFGWAGIRAATLGMVPGTEIFRVDPSEAKPPAIVPTQFPPMEPLEPAAADMASAGYAPAAAPAAPPAQAIVARPAPLPIYYAAASSAPALFGVPPRLRNSLPEPAPQFYSPVPALDEWPLSRIASAAAPPLHSTAVSPAQSLPAALKASKLDRVQLSAWALLRSQRMGVAAPQSLATVGQLGASQTGARLIYNFTRQMAASLRASSEVGRRGGEVAAGLRVQPLLGIPVWVTAERRQRIGRYGGGRNGFALIAEGGLYDLPMPGRFRLNAYIQGGVVGLRHGDRFVDGALTLTQPVYRQFSAGLGVWGGAQPRIYRVDVGPRVTMRVRRNLLVHVDWRQRVAGNAAPGSGPAITLAGDF